MLKKSTIQLLRFPFSWFLMPVFWFALSFAPEIELMKSILIFFIIHFLLYPSSNGYNSYMDRDEHSIGGIKNPLPPEKELYYVTVVMDLLAILLSLFVSLLFTELLILYIVCSRLYSYRGIRLKKYAIIGYLTVIINQGAVIFYMVYVGVSGDYTFPVYGMMAACLLIGGFYPITQIYQHESDKKDGVHTISMLLGKRGTFIFCSLLYLLAFGVLFFFYTQQQTIWLFGILQIFFLPVAIYFFIWAFNVWKDSSKADFEHTMRMNWLASTCTSLAFITLLIFQSID